MTTGTAHGWVTVRVHLDDVPGKVPHPRDWWREIPADDYRWVPQTLGEQIWLMYLNPDLSNLPAALTAYRDPNAEHWANYNDHDRAACDLCRLARPMEPIP